MGAFSLATDQVAKMKVIADIAAGKSILISYPYSRYLTFLSPLKWTADKSFVRQLFYCSDNSKLIRAFQNFHKSLIKSFAESLSRTLAK